MIFSELSLIEKETGLKYDPETATLSGVKNGVPVVVFDNDKKHRFDIVCGAVITERQFGRIYIMAERFPKKTMLGIENVDGCVNIYCKGYNLMQENLPLLIEFLEKLTAYLKSEMRKTTPIQVAKVLELEDYTILTKHIRSDGTVRPPYNIRGSARTSDRLCHIRCVYYDVRSCRLAGRYNHVRRSYFALHRFLKEAKDG